MTTAVPRLDVIVPCYDYADLLTSCVTSVLAQDGVEVRVLVIDDASPDHTATVAEGLARSDSRVEVVRHDHNRGHLATFNHGLELVEADFVSLVSADDVVYPGALRRATQTLVTHESLGFVYGRAVGFSTRPPRARTGWSSTVHHRGDHWVRLRCRRGVNVISSPEVVVRTEVHRRVGGYEASLPHTADLHLWLRLASVADVAFLAGRPQAGYRIHSRSLQRTVHAGPRLDIAERLEMFRHLQRHAWADRLEGLEWLDLAQRALASEAFERAARALERRDVDDAEAFAALGYAARADPSDLHAHRRYERRRRRFHPVSVLSAGAQRRVKRSGAGLRHRYRGT